MGTPNRKGMFLQFPVSRLAVKQYELAVFFYPFALQVTFLSCDICPEGRDKALPLILHLPHWHVLPHIRNYMLLNRVVSDDPWLIQ